MTLQQLTFFCAVCRYHSIVRAAKALYISQPTISTAIHELEKEFHISLFLHTPNRIHLTEKPLQLMRDIVKITEPGGRILDPFAGSGTTVLAAVLEGYSATGIEVTDAYAALSKERIVRELAQSA